MHDFDSMKGLWIRVKSYYFTQNDVNVKDGTSFYAGHMTAYFMGQLCIAGF